MFIYDIFFNRRILNFVMIVDNFIGDFVEFDDLDFLYFGKVMWIRVEIDMWKFV